MNDIFRTARIQKDKNFDGTFFFGVKTTGIFCRPSCPSPVAKEENVLYFDTIFEALEQNFRPCLRCRPDIEVDYCSGSVDGEFLVNSALDMIYDGYLNYNSIRDLAKELLLSDRHLRKLFVDHLGVPPVKIARYHKALFAKKLLIYSDESVTDIAFSAGFGSTRQFNEVFREIFGKTPSMTRRESKNENCDADKTTLLLKYKPPFDLGPILAFLKPRAIKGVELVTDSSYARTFRTQNTTGFLKVQNRPDESALRLTIGAGDIRCFMEIYSKVRRMFDLDTDFRHINRKFAADNILSRGMIDGQVPRLPVAFDPFEFVVRAVLGQQVTVKAATTLAGRIARKAELKTGAGFPSGLDYFFPDPSELLALDLDGLGITRIRQETIRNAAQNILDKRVQLTAHQTFEKFHRDFSALKGIGDWTVNYVAMRGLGMIDSFPATDLGLIKALTRDGTAPTRKQIMAMADQWRPYRSYATLCLWNSGAQ